VTGRHGPTLLLCEVLLFSAVKGIAGCLFRLFGCFDVVVGTHLVALAFLQEGDRSLRRL